jgi:hypothetical protein
LRWRYALVDSKRLGIPEIEARRGEAILPSNRRFRGEASSGSHCLGNLASPRLVCISEDACTVLNANGPFAICPSEIPELDREESNPDLTNRNELRTRADFLTEEEDIVRVERPVNLIYRMQFEQCSSQSFG